MPDLETRVAELEQRVTQLEHPETVPDDTAAPGAPAVPEAAPESAGPPAPETAAPEAPSAL